MAPKASAGIIKFFSNRTVLVVIGVIILVWIIYKAGKNAQKAADNELSWWDKLWGKEDPNKPRTEYIPDPNSDAAWRPNKITDQIYQAFEEDRWYSTSGSVGLEQAWSAFNALNQTQKIAVVNDWDDRYEGTDKPGYFTGNYGTLKQTLEQDGSAFGSSSGFPRPQANIALNWMRAAGIE